MPATRTGRLRAILTVGMTAGAFLVLMPAAGHAQDAFGGWFQQMFGGGQPAQPAYAPRRYDPAGRFEQSYRARRSTRAARRPKASYAALPRPGKEGLESEKLAGKQPVDQKAINADPKAALLQDPTLRPGDIVMMPEGPKVFTGSTGQRKSSGVRHRLRDFSDVKESKAVDKKTRQLLVAMMVPVGALPANEARKYLAKLRRIAPDSEVEPVMAQARSDSGRRVIMPYGEQR